VHKGGNRCTVVVTSSVTNNKKYMARNPLSPELHIQACCSHNASACINIDCTWASIEHSTSWKFHYLCMHSASSAVRDSPLVFPLLAYDTWYPPAILRSQLSSQSTQIGHVSKPKFVLCLEFSMHVFILAHCASAGQSHHQHKQHVAFLYCTMPL
jgi:hypothetical protein